MTHEELLSAITNIITPLREDVGNLKEDVQELKENVGNLKEDVQELKENVQDLENDVQDIKVRVKKIELAQENEILPRLNTIESCYTATYDRYRNSIDEYEAMKQDITVVKTVVAEHSEKLQKIG